MCAANRLEYTRVSRSVGVSRYTSRKACLTGWTSSSLTSRSRHPCTCAVAARAGCHSRTVAAAGMSCCPSRVASLPSLPGSPVAVPAESWMVHSRRRASGPVTGWARYRSRQSAASHRRSSASSDSSRARSPATASLTSLTAARSSGYCFGSTPAGTRGSHSSPRCHSVTTRQSRVIRTRAVPAGARSRRRSLLASRPAVGITRSTSWPGVSPARRAASASAALICLRCPACLVVRCRYCRAVMASGDAIAPRL